MSDDCVIVGAVQKSPIGSPPLKKLKQSRLPFAPVNNKSPKQNDKSSDKKRKLSGSDSPSTTPKTPRSESKDPAADENDAAEPKGSSSSGKSSLVKKIKEGVSKKRGRPVGAKSKSKDESFTSSQSDSSPAVKKGRKSVSDLDSSLDVGKSSRGEKDKPEDAEKPSASDDAQSRDSVQSREEEIVLSDDEESDKEEKSTKEKKPFRSSTRSPAKRPSGVVDKDANAQGSSKKDEPSEDVKEKAAVGRKRGRPAGSKKKSKDESFTSSQGSVSPVGKRGRKSLSKLADSYDADKSTQGEKEEIDTDEDVSQAESKEDSEGSRKDSVKVQSSKKSPKKLEDNICESAEDSNASSDRKDEDGKQDESEKESKVSESETTSSRNEDDAKPEKDKIKSLPSEKEKANAKDATKKRGRPAGSKNKSKSGIFTSPKVGSSPNIKRSRQSVSDLDQSCDESNSSFKDEKPMKKKSQCVEDAADGEDKAETSDGEDETDAEDGKDEAGSKDRADAEDKDEADTKEDKDQADTKDEDEADAEGGEDEDDTEDKDEADAEEDKEEADTKDEDEAHTEDKDEADTKDEEDEADTKDEGDEADTEEDEDEADTEDKDEADKNDKEETDRKDDKDKADAKEVFQSPVNSTNKLTPTNSASAEKNKKNITPQDKDSAKRRRGRPSGSKNKSKSRSSLNGSICSNASEEESSSQNNTPVSKKNKKPVEKTHNILALFASVSKKKKESSQTNNEDGTSNKDKGDKEEKVGKAAVSKGDDNKNKDKGDKDEKVGKAAASKGDDNKNKDKGDKDEKVGKAAVSKGDDDKNKEDDQPEPTESEKSRDLDESTDALEASASEAERSLNMTLSPGSCSDVGKSPLSGAKAAGTPSSKVDLLSGAKKLTPKQKEREAAKLMKIEEKEKQKQEREKQLQEKMAEKERQRKQKEEEKQKQKEEKEKAKEEIRKKRQEEIDAKKQKKEEELRKKEEEKQKKLEEQQRIEEEKRKQSDKLKNKFASFFVAKKREAESVDKDTEGPFKDFRVKEDMHLAPVVRNRLTEDQIAELDKCIATSGKNKAKTYLSILKSGSYVKQKSEKTWLGRKEPSKEDGDDNDDDDDVMVVDGSDDEDIGNCSAMVQDPAASSTQGKKFKAKLLYFCENQRPAYWGTWSKKSSVVSARRPFAQDEIFDYEYDSDDDWEEEETGESLSDSEGEEKEEKEEGDQYEVDNDFFVPHGYLSDDEGKSDEEEEEEGGGAADSEAPAKSKDTERTKNTEQLKLKQAEFEEEMKQKTKVLKPRLFGCLWMADENNNPAYDQLMKILGPHKAITLCSQLPIGSRLAAAQPKEYKDTDGEDESLAEGKPGNFKKYEKTFPEEAVPALIKLLHGNRHGKGKLCREFVDYWRKLTSGELDPDMINPTPVKASVSRTVYISKRKVEAKIQELGSWKRCLDDAKARHHMCWYVSQKKRDEYGLGDLSITNSWTYVNKLLNDKKEEAESEDDTPKAKKIRPITAFAKKIPSTPSSTNTSPSSTPGTTTPISGALSADTPATASASFGNTPSSSAAENTPSRIQPVSGKKSKKKNLFSAKSQDTCTPQKSSIISYFKKNKGISPQPSKPKPKEEKSSGEPDVIDLE